MNDAKLVEVLYTLAYLKSDFLGAPFCQTEPSFLNVVEKVSALHVVENDKVGFTVLE